MVLINRSNVLRCNIMLRKRCLLCYPVLAVLFCITSCVPPDEAIYSGREQIITGGAGTPIYKEDSKGHQKRDIRMERIRDHGCEDNSTDCGRPFGW